MSGVGCEASASINIEATFRANEIDADVLPELTEIDLEKLGVPLGHVSVSLRRLPVWLLRKNCRQLQLPHRCVRIPTPPSDARSQ